MACPHEKQLAKDEIAKEQKINKYIHNTNADIAKKKRNRSNKTGAPANINLNEAKHYTVHVHLVNICRPAAV